MDEPRFCPICDEPLIGVERCPCGIADDQRPPHQVRLSTWFFWTAEVAVFCLLAKALYRQPHTVALGFVVLALTMMLTRTYLQRPRK